MKGRKPKPAAIRKMEGNPGKRPIPKTPKPKAGIPSAPDELSDGAKVVWARLGPRFEAMGVISDVDEPGFALLCQAYADWAELIELARAEGHIVESSFGQKIPNPYASRADKAAEQLRKMLVEFGGTPSSRSRLTLPDGTPAEDDLNAFNQTQNASTYPKAAI